MMNNFDSLTKAIQSRRVVSFYYDGCYRQVEPFLVGQTKSGNVALRAYQIAGRSNSGKNIGWHLFLIDKICSLDVSQETFSSMRMDYNPNDKAMIVIFSHI